MLYGFAPLREPPFAKRFCSRQGASRKGKPRLNLIVGKDLRAMADEYKIAVWKNGRKNKGWAGLVLEHYLGLAQKPLFDRVFES